MFLLLSHRQEEEVRLEVSAVAAALVGYLVSLGLFALINWNFWSWSNDIYVLCEMGHVCANLMMWVILNINIYAYIVIQSNKRETVQVVLLLFL